MTKKVHDAVIIGGGPSGLSTARFLAAKGRDVLLLEKKKEAGKDVICTGIVGREAFDRFDLPESAILSEIQDVKMVSPMGSELAYSHPKPFACIVDRKRFDGGLARLARNEGADVRFENTVSDIRVHDDRVDVYAVQKTGESVEYQARMAVIATGNNHALNKKCGLGHARKYLNGVQSEIAVEENDVTTIYFGNKIAPGVFGWKVPVGREKAKIGILTERDPNGYFGNLLEVASPASSFGDNNKIQIKSIVQGVVDKTYADRILLVGEAGGQVKTTTGGGIFYGLLGSEIASGVILKNPDSDTFSSRSLAEYEKLWKKTILKEILVGYYVRKVCARLNDSQIESLFMIARNNGVFPYIARHGAFDWHGEMILNLVKKTPFLRSFL